ncbi:MAG: YebC/PmpR family DNA-binding transcriptional regulator [Anaerolineales bacterium]|nr:YebC/PmpR family DNA-binding transcriptional regulator [Anaerolineales bacterium]
MSGHSKWSTIKHKKAAEDAKRGKVFTRLAREIVVAARKGGGDPEMNTALALAVSRAKAANMPKENIDRAIKKGTGEDKSGEAYEEVMYEGYGPHGVALMIECATDNRRRTVADLRHVLTSGGGSLGEGGSVAWQFTQSAYFTLSAEGQNEDGIFELAVLGGADDVIADGGIIEIIGEITSFKSIHDQLAGASIQTDDAGLRMIPNQEMDLAIDETVKVMKVIERLEDLDDVQNVYSNLNITDEAIAQFGG